MRDLDMTILDASADSVTGNQLRAAASHFPTGVAIVSSLDNNNEPVGCTISSFLSASLEPPIVAVSLGQTTSTVSHLIAAGKFGISVLSSSQGGIAAVFADREVDHYERFAGVRWRPGRSGVPLLDNGLSSLECGSRRDSDRRSLVDPGSRAGALRLRLGQPAGSPSRNPRFTQALVALGPRDHRVDIRRQHSARGRVRTLRHERVLE